MDGDSSTDGDNCTCIRMSNRNRNYSITEYLRSCMPPYAIFVACLLCSESIRQDR